MIDNNKNDNKKLNTTISNNALNSGGITTGGTGYYTGYSFAPTATTWEEVLKNLVPDSVSLKDSDEEIKRKVAEKIKEVLDEDGTIDIMKKYLLKFIEENIENPENLIKDLLLERDEELTKCKKELEGCKEEIEGLKRQIEYITRQLLNGLYPNTINPMITPDITWSISSSTTTIN